METPVVAASALPGLLAKRVRQAVPAIRAGAHGCPAVSQTVREACTPLEDRAWLRAEIECAARSLRACAILPAASTPQSRGRVLRARRPRLANREARSAPSGHSGAVRGG